LAALGVSHKSRKKGKGKKGKGKGKGSDSDDDIYHWGTLEEVSVTRV
jgi:hypothetical protein